MDDEKYEKSKITFESLENDLKLKENILLKYAKKEANDIEEARDENFKLENLRMKSSSGDEYGTLNVENELDKVKSTLGDTLRMRKEKTQAELATEQAFEALKRQSEEQSADAAARKDELEKLKSMSDALSRSGSVNGNGVPSV
jgi:hypothetical protein